MRDIPLVLGVIAMLPMILMRPHLGVLAWCWTALLVPNIYVFGFASGIRYNLWIAVVTLAAWLLSKERKRVPVNATTVLLGIFLIWGTISTLLTKDPSPATTWVEWDKFIKIIALALIITVLIRTELRIRSLLFAIALSMGFHAVDESTKYILSGGGHKIWGPGRSIIGDNNQFALAIIMVIPILIYLYARSRNIWVRIGLAAAILLQVISVIGTGSRGGLIGIVALGGWILLTTKRKLKYLLIALVLGSVALSLAPERWYARMGTIESARQDDSFMGRVIAWKINLLAAMDHPLVGVGFRSTQDIVVWLHYADDFAKLDFIPTDPPPRTFTRAAHSIYFQVLGDMGFVGLGLYLALLFVAWRNASKAIVRTRDRPELKWMTDLARMLQYSLIPYLVSGAALNMAYFDLSYAIIGLLAVLCELSTKTVVEKEAPNATPLVLERVAP